MPSVSIMRTRPFRWSVTNRRPAASQANPIGQPKCAALAGPPSPEKPFAKPPAPRPRTRKRRRPDRCGRSAPCRNHSRTRHRQGQTCHVAPSLGEVQRIAQPGSLIPDTIIRFGGGAGSRWSTRQREECEGQGKHSTPHGDASLSLAPTGFQAMNPDAPGLVRRTAPACQCHRDSQHRSSLGGPYGRSGSST